MMSKLSNGILGSVLTFGALGIVSWAYTVGKKDGEKDLLKQFSTIAIVSENAKKQEKE